ncbi:toll-like receptor 4 [Mytilus californianus]|uniref:toll-like receptor 4 n=1 Tax=Mytilus californianus TaxID=6549 RepID=UPI002246409A|nr:toll-like receptor 4 [Mytilus californianus]
MFFFVLVLFHLALLWENCVCESKCEIYKRTAHCEQRNLTDVPRRLPETIQRLDLSKNNIKEIESNAFARYQLLQYISLHGNQLTTMQCSSFNGLTRLTTLDISNNKLNISTEHTASDVFNNLISLRNLDISRNYNSFNYYYPFLGNLINLQFLAMDLIHNSDFQNAGLLNLINLEKLVFDYCYVNDLKNRTFTYLPRNIKELHFRKCLHIKSAEAGVLMPLKKLKTLHKSTMSLSDALMILRPFENKEMETIEFIRVNSGYRELQLLASPEAVILTSEMMRHLQKICVSNLILAECGIVDFKPKSLLYFDRPECLKKVVLSGNRFPMFNKFQEILPLTYKLVNLTLFDYSYNPLSYAGEIQYIHNDQPFTNINTGLFFDQDSLYNDDKNALEKNSYTSTKYIDRRYYTATQEYVEKSQAAAFRLKLPENLHTLRLSHFLRKLEFKGKTLILTAPNLQYLDISYFNVDWFPIIQFDGPNKLRFINFSGTKSSIFSLPTSIPELVNTTNVKMEYARLGRMFQKYPNALQFIPSVEVLDISNNNIWFLPEDAFLNNTEIQNLSISYNLLYDIPKAVLSLSNLQLLDIHNNFIQSINETVRKWLEQQNLKYGNTFQLFLKGNRLKCTCDTRDFLEWITKTNISLDIPKRGYRCTLRNGTDMTIPEVMQKYHELFIDCNSGHWLRIGIALLISFVVLTIPLALAVNFRWQLAYWIYRRFRLVIEERMKLKSKYDIYISYGDQSLNWTVNTLIYKLEKSWKMITCLDDRDILGGEICSDAIADSISNSRNVIFVIDDSFQDRIWGKFEIQRAKYEKYAGNLQHIIIIKKHDITVQNFPSELSQIWDDVIFIEWLDNEDNVGWDRLRIALFQKVL